MDEQLVLPEIDNCNWYKFQCDPIAVALIRSEGGCMVTMKVIDDDPDVQNEINSRGYLERAEQIRKYYKLVNLGRSFRLLNLLMIFP